MRVAPPPAGEGLGVGAKQGSPPEAQPNGVEAPLPLKWEIASPRSARLAMTSRERSRTAIRRYRAFALTPSPPGPLSHLPAGEGEPRC